MSDDDIKSIKFGVSYRIGSTNEIYDIIRNGSLFAQHRDVRDWIERNEVDTVLNGDNLNLSDHNTSQMDDNNFLTMSQVPMNLG